MQTAATLSEPGRTGRTDVPRIGQSWPEQGGIYCGLIRGEDGAPDYHLIRAESLPSLRLKWKKAKAWAAELRDGGFSDWTLPKRGAEGWIVCAAGGVEKTWHWFVDTEGSSCAWGCYFRGGGQNCSDQSAEGCAVAVRRFNAQSFNPSESEAA